MCSKNARSATRRPARLNCLGIVLWQALCFAFVHPRLPLLVPLLQSRILKTQRVHQEAGGFLRSLHSVQPVLTARSPKHVERERSDELCRRHGAKV